MSNTIVLIGAGSTNFGLGTINGIFHDKVLEGSHIVLHDINPTALEKTRSIAQRYLDAHHLPYTLSATTDRKTALQGANFCVISIEVGNRFDLWEKDWQLPQQYGFRQVYGENGGPGGLFHAMRIIPPILDICEDIRRICPEAQVLNLSNPMSRICLTVKRKFPDLKLVGLCHEIDSLEHILPELLQTPWPDLEVKAGGLNHFSVVLEAKYKKTGMDAYPDIRARAPEFFKDSGERGLFMEILRVYGLLPITTDSHFGEYIHWAHNVVDHRGILEFYNNYKQWCFMNVEVNEEDLPPDTMSSVVAIVHAMLSGETHAEPAVNVMNEGFLANLPADLVVEVPGVVDRNGVHGVKMGAIPKGFAALLNHEAIVQDLAAEAILTRSRRAALQTLLADPVVTSVHAAEELLDMVIEMDSPWLDYLK